MNITVTVVGDAEIARKLVPQRIVGPKRNFLGRSAITIQGNARKNAPVDTGRLRNSIAFEVSDDSAKVGTNVAYAPFVHFGTRPHFPPISAVAGWAGRHGTSPFLVARGIASHGTKPHPFLADGATQSIPAIKGFIPVLAREIEAAFGGG